MNEQAARQRGLVFTGIYDRSKEVVKARQEEISKKGYKAYLVTVPDSPYSRGYYKGGKGFSVYTERKYMLDLSAEDMRKRINEHEALINRIKERHAQELAVEEKRNNDCIKWLTENGYTI